jgi:ABC-type glycerol-3-phosphate transport system permease component
MVLSKKASTVLFVILIILTGLLFIPFVWAFLNSFKTNNEIFGGAFLPKSWTFKNYIYAWNRGHFDQYMINSITVSVAVVLAKLSLAVPAGYAFAKMSLRKYPVLFYLFLLGMAVPVESFVIVLFFQLKV